MTVRARALAALPLALALLTGSSAANVQTGTPGLTISVATIAAGKLVITGTASSPGIVVAIVGTTLKATADAQKKFSFNVDYRTPDCRVTLSSSSGATVLGTLNFMLSDCGPGTLPRGPWAGTAATMPGTWRCLLARLTGR